MVYKPNEQELKRIQNLNEAYTKLREGLSIIKNNVIEEDPELDVYIHRIDKSIQKMNKRLMLLLEKDSINIEFLNIIGE